MPYIGEFNLQSCQLGLFIIGGELGILVKISEIHIQMSEIM